jgi:hypothetical protein
MKILEELKMDEISWKDLKRPESQEAYKQLKTRIKYFMTKAFNRPISKEVMKQAD